MDIKKFKPNQTVYLMNFFKFGIDIEIKEFLLWVRKKSRTGKFMKEP